jgi:hypothetical protein
MPDWASTLAIPPEATRGAVASTIFVIGLGLTAVGAALAVVGAPSYARLDKGASGHPLIQRAA